MFTEWREIQILKFISGYYLLTPEMLYKIGSKSFAHVKNKIYFISSVHFAVLIVE